MFGLTRREQRWKAEQKAAETVLGFAAAVAQASASVDADELKRLRADNERLRADSVPLGAIRALVVEAIREVIGCPDLKGNNGKYLVDECEKVAKLATYSAIDSRGA